MKTDQELFSEVDYFVESTEFEQNLLEEQSKLTWQILSTWFCIIGTIGKNKPISLEFTLVWINGILVCFYHVVSRYNDRELTLQYIETQTKYKKSQTICNPEDFRNLVLKKFVN